jgi:DNA polymerase III delta prime subunit
MKNYTFAKDIKIAVAQLDNFAELSEDDMFSVINDLEGIATDIDNVKEKTLEDFSDDEIQEEFENRIGLDEYPEELANKIIHKLNCKQDSWSDIRTLLEHLTGKIVCH